MIKVKVKKTGDSITCVEVSGHANYARSGKDIVCSAVSGITYTALLGLIEFSTRKVEYVVNDENGYMKFIVPVAESEEEEIRQQTILRTMIIGLQDLEKGYKAYVNVEV